MDEPVGVELDVLIVKVLEKVGFSEDGINEEQEAPEGRLPVQDRLTDCVEPLVNVTVTVFEPDEPWVTVIPPELDIEKSKLGRAKLAVSVMNAFMVTDAGFAGPEYDVVPEPVHELNVYPDAGKAWMPTVCPELYQYVPTAGLVVPPPTGLTCIVSLYS